MANATAKRKAQLTRKAQRLVEQKELRFSKKVSIPSATELGKLLSAHDKKDGYWTYRAYCGILKRRNVPHFRRVARKLLSETQLKELNSIKATKRADRKKRAAKAEKKVAKKVATKKTAKKSAKK